MNPKVINSINARLARIEAMLENSDVFKQAEGATYGGLQYEGSQTTYNFQPLEQELAQNYGFGANDMTIFEMQQRIADLELQIAGGSNDTNQSGALDAGAGVGDDGETGTGQAGLTESDIGTMAFQNSDAVDISGGTLSGVSADDMASLGITTDAGTIYAKSAGGTLGVSISAATGAGGSVLMYNSAGTVQGEVVASSTASGISMNASSTGYVRLGTSLNSLAFFGQAGSSRPTVTGSRGGNAALASLLTALATLGLIVDSSS